MKTTLLLLSLFVFPQEPSTLSLSYTDGEPFNAKVLELKGDSVRLKVLVLGGSMQVTRKLVDFTPASVFQIEMAANPPSGFEGHFKMAKRAAELNLLSSAGSEARQAIAAVTDPAQAEAKKKEVRGWAAGALEKMIHDAIAEDRLADAQHCLKLLSTRLNDQRTEEQIDALETAVEGLEEKVAGKRQAKVDAKTREQMNGRLQKVRQGLAAGDKSLKEAIAKSRSTVASSNLCEKAIESYKAAWKLLQELNEKNSDDVDFQRAAAPLTQQLHNNGIRAALHAANVLTVQSDYKGAMDWANRVLAFDPDNAEAKEMVRTIQTAAAAASGDWGWGWRVVGGSGSTADPRKY